MKLPRDISGTELARLLHRYGYRIVRQTGSHVRLTSNARGTENHITIPAHNPLKIGTLSSVLRDVAEHLDIDLEILAGELFGR